MLAQEITKIAYNSYKEMVVSGKKTPIDIEDFALKLDSLIFDDNNDIADAIVILVNET